MELEETSANTGCCKRIWPSCSCENRPNFKRLLFWLAIAPSVAALLLVYGSSMKYYNFWSAVYMLNVIYFIDCVWFCLLCPVGFFILHFRVTDKIVATLYSLGLCSVIVCAAVCILKSQFTRANMDDGDDIVVQSVREYFSENEDIPLWMHTIQNDKKCCGFSGPKDWKDFVYPIDKPAIEDVPISCCIVQATGCNLILGETANANNTIYQEELAKLVYTNGCKKSVQFLFDGILCYVAYGSTVLILLAIIIITLYWWQLIELTKEEVLMEEILNDLERRRSRASCSSGRSQSVSRRSSTSINANRSRSRSRSSGRQANRNAAFPEIDDDGVGDVIVAQRITDLFQLPRNR